jgi:hypothetical protein
MYSIDHISLGIRHIYEGCHRLREEYGLDNYDGGWFRGTGIANRIVPLPGDSYLEMESVVDQRAAGEQLKIFDDWFGRALGGGQDHWMFWSLRTESLEELEEMAARLGSPAPRTGGAGRIYPTGETQGSHWNTPSAITSSMKLWAKGLPNFYFWGDMSHHPSRREVQHTQPISGVSWLEVGGDAKAMKEHIGAETFDSLDLRFVQEVPGLYGVGISTQSGEEIAIRNGSGAQYLEV